MTIYCQLIDVLFLNEVPLPLFGLLTELLKKPRASDLSSSGQLQNILECWLVVEPTVGGERNTPKRRTNTGLN